MLNKKLENLKKYLIESGEATPEEMEKLTVTNTYNEYFETFEIIGNEYKVLTDEEADNLAIQEIKNNLWAFNTNFILEHTKFYENSTSRENEIFVESLQKMQGDLCESATPIISALIEDIDDFINDAIEADGRGHYLSYYDGEEIESGEFYIYRTNWRRK